MNKIRKIKKVVEISFYYKNYKIFQTKILPQKRKLIKLINHYIWYIYDIFFWLEKIYFLNIYLNPNSIIDILQNSINHTMNIKKKKRSKDVQKFTIQNRVDIPSRKNEKVLKRMQIHPTEISICKGCEFTRIAKIRKKKKKKK